jgi:hypothetical protein
MQTPETGSAFLLQIYNLNLIYEKTIISLFHAAKLFQVSDIIINAVLIFYK